MIHDLDKIWIINFWQMTGKLTDNQLGINIKNVSKSIKRPTIFDVAKLAGVSISSVSRVLNNSTRVTENMRERVLDAISKLKYQPSAIAQGLVTKSIKSIGLIITDINNPFFTELIHGAENKTSEHGYNLLFCNTDENVEKEANYIRVLSNNLVAGFIISATRMSDENIFELKKSNVPFVLINRYLDGIDTPCVRTNFKSGMNKAFSHLVEAGHRKILLLNGPIASQASRLREEGYINSMASFGLVYNPDLNRSCQPTKDGGFVAINEVIDQGIEFTAAIVYNDLMAVGVLDALRFHKLRVPRDIAIVSFDDTILAKHSYPPLTSVRQDSELLGRLSAELLLDIIEGKELEARDIVLNPELIVRESSSN